MLCPAIRYFIGWKRGLEKSDLEERGTRKLQIVLESRMNIFCHGFISFEN